MQGLSLRPALPLEGATRHDLERCAKQELDAPLPPKAYIRMSKKEGTPSYIIPYSSNVASVESLTKSHKMLVYYLIVY